MNRRIILLIACLVLSAVNVPAGHVQDDASMQTFWEKFKAAVTRVDKPALAGMTQFPLTMPYRVPTVRTRAQFLKRYREVFNEQADAAKCFATAKPEKDPAHPKTFTIGCGEFVVYGFAWTRTGWKLAYLDNVAE